MNTTTEESVSTTELGRQLAAINLKKKKTPTTALPKPIAEIHLIPLAQIDIEKQVRTKFDQTGIDELAEDIAKHGLLQPVLLNPNPNNGRFKLIAGERRLMAVRQNGNEGIPALIMKIEEKEIRVIQLSENIQREELSLEDESQTVLELYELLGSLKAVSEKIHKSVPWCSKRYALKKEGLHWRAKNLLSSGVTEDLELLNAFSALAELVNYQKAQELNERIAENKIGRAEIRDELKRAKAAKKAQEKNDSLKVEKLSQAKTKEPVEPVTPVWTLEVAIIDLEKALTWNKTEKSAKDIYHSWSEEQQAEVKTRFEELAKKGSFDTGFCEIGAILFQGAYSSKMHDIELLAMIRGHGGLPFDLNGFFNSLQVPVKSD